MLIYFGLGSNLGDKLENLRAAVEKLKTLGEIKRASSVYETEPWGGVEQPDYLNACVLIECTNENITPLEILRAVKSFEVELGRVPSIRWGERKIDIDILLIDDVIYKSPELNIPHISIPDRLFVLVPLEEILPTEWRHPENHKSIQAMINDIIKDNGALPIKISQKLINGL